jgi:hypothetical protein
MYYIPQYLALYELLPKEFYGRYYPHRGNSLFTLFDERLLRAGDAVRREFGKIVVNTWKWGGHNQYRGYRPADCTVGALFSQHRFGRALDLITVETPVETVRQRILNGEYDSPEIRFITGIELNVSWLHIDTRNQEVAKFGIKTFEAM